MGAFIKKNYHFLFFAAFLALEAALVFCVVPFGDDYYYMTFLSGGFGNFVKLNASHYLEVNGRAIVHLIDELILFDRSLTVWKFVGVALIGAIVWLTALVSVGGERKSEKFPAALVLSSLLFALIDVRMANETFLWVTGAMNYVLPLPILLWYYLVYKKFTKTKRLPAGAFVLAFFASAMIEQCAFAAVVITGLIIYTSVLNKIKPRAALILCVLFSLAGFAFLFLAPGNSVRTTYYPEFYQMPLYKRIISNIKPLASTILSRRGSADVLAAYFVLGGVRRMISKKRAAVFLGAADIFAAILVMIHVHIGGVMAIAVAAAAVSAICFAFDVILSLPALRAGDADGVFFTLVPAVLQGAMLISPLNGARTVLCSVVLIFIPTARDGVFLLRELKQRVPALASVCVIAALVAVAGLCAPRITGYAKNRNIQTYNMQNVSICKENGGELVYYYMPVEDCRYVLPYDNAYHQYWFKSAYGLPNDTVIRYEFP